MRVGKRAVLVACALAFVVACDEEKTIAIQDGSGCGIRADGTAVCWGTGSSYNLTPPAGVTFEAVVVSQDFGSGITTAGTLRSWGRFTSAPTGNYVGIAAGRLAACAVRDDGDVRCWGQYSGTYTGNYIDIAMSDQTTVCAIDDAFHVDCWNLSSTGTPPLEPSASDTFGQISLGGGGCGIRTDRSIVCWGNSLTPPTGTDWNEVATGNGFACAARTNGLVSCWGSNTYGQSTPPSGTFIELTAFGQSICGERTNGTVSCWGASSFGVTSPPAGLVLRVEE